ncbi:MAG: manganese efflux pump MntP family protein [Defluviitaleaceae bacterium]|nr:manganese efflux pump MntP family protein [Defluviitaleaceae bacterium]MCL2240126.1 manganese efflux pump MntP family protein [Defluviitaleaceae bacterium]
MPLAQLVLLAVGLSMDAFAVAVTLGLGIHGGASGGGTLRRSVVVGAYFGFFQALMPLIGFFAARSFAQYIMAFDRYVVFALLAFLGGKMIYSAFKSDPDTRADTLSPHIMLPFALATSIDALAVGISFAFLYVNITVAVILIGVITFGVSAVGVKIGSVFGERFKTKATVAGGLILILIGLRVLLQ